MSLSARLLSRHGQTRSTRLVMIGASAGAFLLLLLSAFTSWPVAGGPLAKKDPLSAAYEAVAGDCLNWTRPDLSDVAKVDCSAEHLFEVSGTADVSAAYPAESPFPDGALWQRLSQENCAQTSLTYLSNKFDQEGKYSVGAFNPGERRWKDGNRTLRCGLQVAAPSGRLLPSFGSAKTQDQSDVYDPGVCLGVSKDNSIGDPVPCAEPHTFEIVGVVELGAAEFVPLEKQDALLSEQCAKIATEYTGGADLKAKGLLVAWDTRTAESWAAGSHKANCKIGAVPADGKLVAWPGSLRNPNAPPLKPSNPPQTTTVRPQDEPTGAPMHSQSETPSSGPPSSGGLLPLPTKSSAPPTSTSDAP